MATDNLNVQARQSKETWESDQNTAEQEWW